MTRSIGLTVAGALLILGLGLNLHGAGEAAQAGSDSVNAETASGTVSGETRGRPAQSVADEEKRGVGDVETFAGIEFVWIPPGTFTMGDTNGDPDEQAVHRVTLTRGFWMGKYLVTQAQWLAVMGGNPSYRTDDPQRPVEQVSWNDVQRFITKLNTKHPGHDFRLPTEAEWEYACRAGAETKYCFGNDARLLGEYAWYYENSEGQTHPVGQKRPNAWGLYDMHGNVVELVQDWCGPYESKNQTDPTGPVSGKHRIRRGGGYYYGADKHRSGNRRSVYMDFANNCLGFRLVR